MDTALLLEIRKKLSVVLAQIVRTNRVLNSDNKALCEVMEDITIELTQFKLSPQLVIMSKNVYEDIKAMKLPRAEENIVIMIDKIDTLIKDPSSDLKLNKKEQISFCPWCNATLVLKTEHRGKCTCTNCGERLYEINCPECHQNIFCKVGQGGDNIIVPHRCPKCNKVLELGRSDVEKYVEQMNEAEPARGKKHAEFTERLLDRFKKKLFK